ncbi:MAG: tetraacyldisaccharide 4'-kinase [Candidatus Cloacimonetes bacterium]|nr:tetraacyldisaccharide 4'-kinase [Candidatus Cloacimonadota bacterium]
MKNFTVNRYITADILNTRGAIAYVLYPFSLIYGVVQNIRRAFYRAFPQLIYQPDVPVISVGNITCGGAGKTPFVLWLVSQLKSTHQIAIVLRGYKGKLENQNILVSDLQAKQGDISSAGDEAALYTEKLPGVPVMIGKNRVKSIKILQARFPDLDLVIMDDAFQYLAVQPELKICVFNTIAPFSNGFYVPAGLLREPLKNLREADFFVCSGDKDSLPKEAETYLKTYKKPILSGFYEVQQIVTLSGQEVKAEDIRDKRNVLLSGIGTPKSFENTIQKAGISFFDHFINADHFSYDQAFMDKLSDHLALKCDYIVTTEKDFTKIKDLRVNIPLLVVKINFVLSKKDSSIDILQTIKNSKNQKILDKKA